MDDQHTDHIVETIHQLVHDLLNRSRADAPLLQLHDFFHVAAVAVLHEDVIPRICLDRLPHFDNEIAVDCILV